MYFYRIINEEKVTIGELKNKELVLVSAIGSPECFEKTILRLGLKINKHFIFRDHHLYTKNDLTRVEDYCKRTKLDTVVTTEKDAVKLKSCQLSAVSCQLLVLKVRLEIIENEDGVHNRLFGIYSS
jgi:tetraacyldisaccharide 4'-kinase